MATRVKELQAEWTRLDGIDGDQAPAKDAGISRRFRALCHHALAPAKAYFEKRRELRGERAQDVEQLLAETLTDESDPRALLARQKALRGGLDQLPEVAAEKRGELAARLRAELDRLSGLLQAQREEALLAKRKLLAKLKRDLGSAEGAAAIALAKAAQADWKQLPRARRQEEDALWKELRELIDPLFEGLRQQQDAEQAQRQQIEQQAAAILQELDELAAAEPERLLHADAHLDSLRARWRELNQSLQPERSANPGRSEGGGGRDGGRDAGRGPRRDRPGDGQRGPQLDERRFDRASAAVLEAQAAVQRRRQARQIETLCQAAELLEQTSDSEQRASRLAALDLPPGASERLLAAWTVDAAAVDAATSASEPDVELLAVRAELAAGLDSPAADQALRKREQMQRLARKLEGQAAPRAADEVLDCLIELQCQPRLGLDQRRALGERIRQAYLRALANPRD